MNTCVNICQKWLTSEDDIDLLFLLLVQVSGEKNDLLQGGFGKYLYIKNIVLKQQI